MLDDGHVEVVYAGVATSGQTGEPATNDEEFRIAHGARSSKWHTWTKSESFSLPLRVTGEEFPWSAAFSVPMSKGGTALHESARHGVDYRERSTREGAHFAIAAA